MATENKPSGRHPIFEYDLVLDSQASLNFALTLINNRFKNRKKPSIPDSMEPFMPCRIVITERRGPKWERIGRIQIIQDDTVTLFEHEWEVAPY